MIDLHTHVLPGLDDGPSSLDEAVALASLACERGTRVLVATPHIRDDFPFELEEIEQRADELRHALVQGGIDIGIVTGGELGIAKATELGPEAMSAVCLGAGPYILVESPYTLASELLEGVLFDLQARGFRPILAHPERAPSFAADLPRLREIVRRGVLCSVTGLSMSGGFGSTVRRFTGALFAEGLVHNVASDCHDRRRRPPGLLEGFEALRDEFPSLNERAGWFTADVPRALLDGKDVPPGPGLLRRRRRGLGRLRASP